jgi:hypothetical protein
MADLEIGGVSPLFIVKDVPASLAFYRVRLGFDITFEGPEPNDIFFGIVQRGRAMIMFKSVGVPAIPNHMCNIGQGIARWDAYVHVPDPDALAASSRRARRVFEPLRTPTTACVDSNSERGQLRAVLRPSYRPTSRCSASGQRSPCSGIAASASSISRRSDEVSVSVAAPRFSSRRWRLVVAGGSR